MRAGIFASARHAAGGATYGSQVLADSPFCYFPLNDVSTPTDVMGNVTPSAVTGVTLGAAGIGDGVTAASFDGGATGRGIVIPNAQLPATNTITAMTFEVLAQAANMTSQRALFARDNVTLLRHSNAAAIRGYTGVSWANQIGTDYAEGSPTAVHHWAIVWDGANATLYRDGVSIATEAVAGTFSATAQNLFIGSRASTDLTFLGALAGFAYYTTALSAARILAHAQAAGVA
jgi:hypothetical protein